MTSKPVELNSPEIGLSADLDDTNVADMPGSGGKAGADTQQKSREIAAKLLPHTTSVENVELIAAALQAERTETIRLARALHLCAAMAGNPKGRDEACRLIIKHVQATITDYYNKGLV